MKHILDYMIRDGKASNYNQLSKKLGVSHATVLRWLSGADKPDAPNCIKLAELSGLKLSYIMHVVYGV